MTNRISSTPQPTTSTMITSTASHQQHYNPHRQTISASSLSADITPSPTQTPTLQRRFLWRPLPAIWSKIVTARSRRKRRKRDEFVAPCPTSTVPSEEPYTASYTTSTPDAAAAAGAATYLHRHVGESGQESESKPYRPARPAMSFVGAATTAVLTLPQKIIDSAPFAAYVTALLFVLTASCCMANPPCENHSWWDPVKDKCIPCTVCQEEMIPLRPCQQHRDTICGSIYDLKIDWVVLAKTEPNWKERRKSDGNIEHLEQQQQLHLTHEQIQQFQEENMPLDWQTGALFIAVLACLVFFIVAACILIHHMRQWRRMERRLDQDVEELSTKLMAKLAEVQSLEGGTFFIGSADALRVPTTFQPQHVLLPEKHAKHHHHHDRRIIKNLQPGNVYIEENSSKG